MRALIVFAFAAAGGGALALARKGGERRLLGCSGGLAPLQRAHLVLELDAPRSAEPRDSSENWTHLEDAEAHRLDRGLWRRVGEGFRVVGC